MKYYCLDLGEERIERKLNYCRQLLKLADVIEPGLSQLRGHLLFELQSAMEHKANRAFKRGSAEFKVLTIRSGCDIEIIFYIFPGTNQGSS